MVVVCTKSQPNRPKGRGRAGPRPRPGPIENIVKKAKNGYISETADRRAKWKKFLVVNYYIGEQGGVMVVCTKFRPNRSYRYGMAGPQPRWGPIENTVKRLKIPKYGHIS